MVSPRIASPVPEIIGSKVFVVLGLLKKFTVKLLLPVSEASQFKVTGKIFV